MDKLTEKIIRVPAKYTHLANDLQIEKAALENGATVMHTRRLTKIYKDGRYVAYTPRDDCQPHPVAYRASILRALIRFGILAAIALSIWALLF